MSIFPAADIVSDVAGAADPRRAKIALQRLESAATVRAASPRSFDPALRSTERSSASQASFTISESSRQVERATESPSQKFEAFLLQSWLETLLPKEEGGVFGTGSAGSVWRSLLAEQLGAQLAAAGGVGMQKLIEQSYSGTTDARA